MKTFLLSMKNKLYKYNKNYKSNKIHNNYYKFYLNNNKN